MDITPEEAQAPYRELILTDEAAAPLPGSDAGASSFAALCGAASVGEQNLIFQAALENMAQGLCMFDKDNRAIVFNSKYVTLFGCDPEIVKPGISLRDVYVHSIERGLYPGADPDIMVSARMASIRRDRVIKTEMRLANGSILEAVISPMANGGWIATYDDVTTQRQQEQELVETLTKLDERNHLFDVAIENMPQGLSVFDSSLRLKAYNQRVLKIFEMPESGMAIGSLFGQAVYERIVEYVACNPGNEHLLEETRLRIAKIRAKLADRQAFREVIETCNGKVLSANYHPLEDGGWVATYEDVSEQHQSARRIEFMARHDSLTGLPNRLSFSEHMTEQLAVGLSGNQKLAFFCIDLDRFKTVNDTLGHPIGDRLLQQVAQRIRVTLPPGAFAARLGGDEFAILLRISDASEAAAVAERLIDQLGVAIPIDDHQLSVGASVGIAIAPEDGSEAADLMKHADLALYQAKADGRDRSCFYSSEMSAELAFRAELEKDLRTALANNQLRIVYQPQVSVTQGIEGFEALMRWDHPIYGPISPVIFIDLAEDTGLIHQLGQWILKEACQQAAHWPSNTSIAVNLSPVQFESPHLVANVLNALTHAGLPPARLELEITEAVLLKDEDRIRTALRQLRDLGVRIALDDFGTGYSSLGYLRRFSFDKIKIDRSFIIDLGLECQSIVRAIAAIGRDLKIRTCVEGVETEQQLAFVNSAGCNQVQGYLFSRPVASDGVAQLFAQFGTCEGESKALDAPVSEEEEKPERRRA